MTHPEGGLLDVTFYGRENGSGDGFQQIGGVQTDVPSGSKSSMSWPWLLPSMTYEWYVEVYDGINTIVGPTWSFTTTGIRG